MVSVLIPRHGGADRTVASIAAAAGDVPHEVIIEEAGEEGFLHAVNRAAARAQGEFLAIVNGGNEPRPGWLEALVERARSDPGIGAVAPKVVTPGALVHEAGGVVFADGTLWKYGNAHPESDHVLDYTRDTDYGSGEALLVRRDAWEAAGGLDERFAPGFWCDADLCFALRDHGLRVVFDPGSVVVRPDDGTPGIDPTMATPEQREHARRAFAGKWGAALENRPGEPSHDEAYAAVHRSGAPLVLVIDHGLPDPARDAGSVRLAGVLENLRELGCGVIFIPGDGALPEPAATHWRRRGIELPAAPIDLGGLLRRLGGALDLAILCRPNVAPRYLHTVRRHAPGARVVYDAVDLHHLREERRIALEGGADLAAADAYRELELALVRACDATLVAASHERELLEELVPGADVAVLPMAHESRDVVPPAEGREGQLFVGGFAHDPNVDAALHLVGDLMPPLREELGDAASLSIVGPDPPPEVAALAAGDVQVKGWVEDLDPLLDRARVSVAPLRYGAGMKGKVTQSMAAGLPVVTTSVGAEGLGAESGRDLLVADDDRAFVKAVADLHRDAELWQTLSANGRALAGKVASHEAQLGALRTVLSEALGRAAPRDPPARRPPSR